MRLVLVFLGLFFSVAPAFAEGAYISMSGRGSVSAAPDVAEISVGVTTTSPTADRAMRANAARMNEVFALLEAQKIQRADIQTVQFSVNPQWSNRQTSIDKPLEIDGFVATNILRIKVRNIPALGAVLDALATAGANRIESISFSITDQAPLLDRARVLAVEDARHKAEVFAKAAGVTLGAIEMISETADVASPVFRAEALRLDASPIAEGTQIVSADVTIRWALD